MKHSRLSPARIARSLVTTIVLSLVNIIAGPVLAPSQTTPLATAANSSIIQSNLLYSANATYLGSDFGQNNMTLTGNPVYSNTRPGYYTFDSDSKWASSNIDYVNGAQASIFMWIYPTAAGVVLNLTGSSNATNAGVYRTSVIDYTGTRFRFGLYNSSGLQYVEANVDTPVNNWYFIGLTYNGSVLTSYVNGVATGTVNVGTWLTAGQGPGGNYFHIAAPQNGTWMPNVNSGGRFRIGEIMYYTVGHSASEVIQNYNATISRFAPIVTNPTSTSIMTNRSSTFSISCSGVTSANGTTACGYQWQRSIDSGGTWSDISGATSSSYTTGVFNSAVTGYQYRVRAYDPGSGSPGSTLLMSYSAAAAVTVTQQPGSDTDTALNFDGSTEYASADDNSAFDVTGAISVEAWVKPSAVPANGSTAVVVQKSGAYELIMSTTGGVTTWKYGLWGTSAWNGVSSNVVVRTGEWHHLAFTRDASSSTVKFYYDGYLVRDDGGSDTVGTGSINNSTYPFVIGARYTDGVGYQSKFTGAIDHVAVFDVVRSESDIRSDMHGYIDRKSVV